MLLSRYLNDLIQIITFSNVRNYIDRGNSIEACESYCCWLWLSQILIKSVNSSYSSYLYVDFHKRVNTSAVGFLNILNMIELSIMSTDN